MSDDPTKPNTSKYQRPTQIEHLSHDQLVAALLRITMEVSVIRDRLSTCESLLHKHGIFDVDAIENYHIDADESAQRTAARMSLIEKVVGDLS
ncbi:MAG: hypothetical protein AB8G16_13920 [Gammaproteobacteria bacterium]